jgi:predicted short-subunit dehydrogenase-like oxidoreductase (DUF2520 family)
VRYTLVILLIVIQLVIGFFLKDEAKTVTIKCPKIKSRNTAKAIKLPTSKIYAPATVTVAVGN